MLMNYNRRMARTFSSCIVSTEVGSAPAQRSGAPAPAPGLKMERRSRSRSDFQKGAALPLPLRTKRSAAPFSAPTLKKKKKKLTSRRRKFYSTLNSVEGARTAEGQLKLCDLCCKMPKLNLHDGTCQYDVLRQTL